MKPLLRRLIPDPIWREGSRLYWWWHNRGRHRGAATFSARWRKSRRALESFRQRYRGERCFILGNGPSLRVTDLSLLRGETTFGTNRIYLLFQELGFTTTFYTAVNTLVIEQCATEIRSLNIPKFLTWRARGWVAEDRGVVFLDTDYTGPETFAQDLTSRVFEGGTVTYVAMQLAYYMGFSEVILVGVDHNYASQGPANETVISDGEDPNHFHPDYFGKGFRWQLPDLEASERSYELAREAFERDGRRILDATIGGKLSVFPKVDYASFFGK